MNPSPHHTTPPEISDEVRKKLIPWSSAWFALGSRSIPSSTARMLRRLGLVEHRICPSGMAVSRYYDWRLTERGELERRKLQRK